MPEFGVVVYVDGSKKLCLILGACIHHSMEFLWVQFNENLQMEICPDLEPEIERVVSFDTFPEATEFALDAYPSEHVNGDWDPVVDLPIH